MTDNYEVVRKECLTGEEIRYNPKGEYHLNNYLKNKTEKILNRTTKKTGNDKTRGSDLVKQFVSKSLKNLLSKVM
ncbi:hypothetical protein A9X50_06325 [Salmonella enterica subsp. enterica serovar Enteritidis]|nr:hypothetical protein [Salmonella enterica subsp. enterica serovar Enteritidis]